MSFEPINIIPYRPDLDADILEIEKKALQGTLVKFEMLRDNYISRAAVFQAHGGYVGFNQYGRLVGAAIGAKVPLKINGKEFKAGFGLDMRVSPSWRNKGAAKQLTGFVMRNFFRPHNLTKNFITMKASNNPIMSVGLNLLKSSSVVDFSYLVIPTQTRINVVSHAEQQTSFTTELMDRHDRFPEYISAYKDDLYAWHTYKMYRLKIDKIHPIAALSTMIVSLLKKKKYPAQGDEIKTATLFNLTGKNIIHINEALDHLGKQGVNYVNVVCKKNDATYHALKSYAIFDYDHYLMADFTIGPNDKITIDVRCL
ncbi:MAG TPA: hypothetical protein VFX73_06605 [Chitinophagaceae bacterium]|nr:hypothetical protein [Chitinophagaceae bacterium]